jgi:hypothetical protein
VETTRATSGHRQPPPADYLVPFDAAFLVAAVLLAEVAPPSRIPQAPIAWLVLRFWRSLPRWWGYPRDGRFCTAW